MKTDKRTRPLAIHWNSFAAKTGGLQPDTATRFLLQAASCAACDDCYGTSVKSTPTWLVVVKSTEVMVCVA